MDLMIKINPERHKMNQMNLFQNREEEKKIESKNRILNSKLICQKLEEKVLILEIKVQILQDCLEKNQKVDIMN